MVEPTRRFPTMNLSEYSSYDGLGLAQLVKNRDVSAAELAQVAGFAIERLNPTLNAVVDIYADRLSAVDADTNLDGDFAGVPMLLKDIGATEKNRPQCSGSRLGSGYVAGHDSYLTRFFKQAGFNIVGRTNLPEFAQAATTENRYFGDTHNPWNPGRSPGGSSGGAGAAVAAGIVPIAHGTDTGGSIRIPAACCGVVGLKPSRGRVSKGPQLDETLYGGLNTEFVLTRSVRDAAAVLDSVAGEATGDPYSLRHAGGSFAAACGVSPRPLRIAVQIESLFAEIVSEVAGATGRIAHELEAEGHQVAVASPKFDVDDWMAAERTIWIQSTAWEMKRLSVATGNRIGEENLEPLSLAAWESAKCLTADEWFEAKMCFNRICRSVGGFFNEFDILITPTIARTAPPLGAIAGSNLSDYDSFIRRTGEFSPFASLFNITGQPAISLPLASNEQDMPIGIQLVAGFGNEQLLLQTAAQLERLMPWLDRRPLLHVGKELPICD